MNVGPLPVALLPAVRVSDDVPDEHLGSHLFRGRVYLVLGEPAIKPTRWTPDGGVNHWVLLDMKTGQVLPGMWHDHTFVAVSDEDDIL
jgi:hypothetical protein